MTIKALYPTVLPSLNLDFANSKQLDRRISFTRSSSATFIGADGLLKTAAANTPRFDHTPSTGESLGLLVEEARTNLALYSGDFSNVAWVASETTKNANALVAPDGTITAALFVPTAVNAAHRFRQSIATATAELTFSVYLKAAGYSRIALNEQAQTGVSSAIINLTNGTGATSGTVVSNAGNGWYRVSWSSTFTTGSPKLFNVVILPNGGSGENPNSFSWTGDGTSGVYVWGAQLEAGAFPTSYIPTTTATVTRAADVASMTGTNFNAFGSTFLFTGFAVLASVSNRRHAQFDGGTGENRLLTSNDFYTSGTSGGNSGSPVSITSDGTQSNYALAFSYDGSVTEKRSAKNGALNSNTSAAGLFLPSDPTFKFGANDSNMAGGYLARKTFKRIAYYPVRLPDGQLQALTAT